MRSTVPISVVKREPRNTGVTYARIFLFKSFSGVFRDRSVIRTKNNVIISEIPAPMEKLIAINSIESLKKLIIVGNPKVNPEYIILEIAASLKD